MKPLIECIIVNDAYAMGKNQGHAIGAANFV
jgi:hypothetical protein